MNRRGRRRRRVTDPLHEAELREAYAALSVLAALRDLKEALIERRELLEAAAQAQELRQP